jgi:hypothetical protein
LLATPLGFACGEPAVGPSPDMRRDVEGLGVVEVREVVGKEKANTEDKIRFAEVEIGSGVDCKTEVGTGTAIGVGVGISRVDATGIKTDRVEVIMPIEVITPPAPVHLFPLGQQPYSPFVPRSQKLPKGQPPVLSGQHVSDILMHPVPQSFLPCWEQGIGVKVWRRTSCSESSAVTKATAAKSR